MWLVLKANRDSGGNICAKASLPGISLVWKLQRKWVQLQILIANKIFYYLFIYVLQISVQCSGSKALRRLKIEMYPPILLRQPPAVPLRTDHCPSAMKCCHVALWGHCTPVIWHISSITSAPKLHTSIRINSCTKSSKLILKNDLV